MAARQRVDRDEFARLDGQGWTLARLAAHFGVNERTVGRVRRELGLSRDHFLAPERLAWIEARLEEGWSFAEISRTDGVDPETLRRHFPGRAWTTSQRDDHTRALRHFERDLGKAAYVITHGDLRKALFVT
ncbi:hypothetical protein [Arthrobacter sp. B2a2-09]|uniref:hypothetical protein n=1 Tax=Arthrobacter sp. B2a2-09 TaxID=2952822 RepID=UPI0022CDB851|nr:hypothetical protein [Arthrobacter sp. B2a2-09]MCZ9884612.1 hypothetical protein [Arthrobacter sp. B2a2-09]